MEISNDEWDDSIVVETERDRHRAPYDDMGAASDDLNDLQEDDGVNDSRIIKNKVTMFEREKLNKYSKSHAIGRSPSVSKATKNI